MLEAIYVLSLVILHFFFIHHPFDNDNKQEIITWKCVINPATLDVTYTLDCTVTNELLTKYTINIQSVAQILSNLKSTLYIYLDIKMRILYTSIYRTGIYYKIISTLSTKCIRIRSVYRRIFSNLKITNSWYDITGKITKFTRYLLTEMPNYIMNICSSSYGSSFVHSVHTTFSQQKHQRNYDSIINNW